MPFETRHPASTSEDNGVGNIYDRLDAARQRRERILDTPSPANDDRRTSRKPDADYVFPTLKPPRPDMPDVAVERSWAWTVPWLVGAAIVAVIFVFAVR